MKMDQTHDESNTDAPASDQFFDRIDLAMERQLELCVAAYIVLERLEGFKSMQGAPEVAALHGIISAIGQESKSVQQEVEVTSYDQVLKAAFSGEGGA